MFFLYTSADIDVRSLRVCGRLGGDFLFFFSLAMLLAHTVEAKLKRSSLGLKGTLVFHFDINLFKKYLPGFPRGFSLLLFLTFVEIDPTLERSSENV